MIRNVAIGRVSLFADFVRAVSLLIKTLSVKNICGEFYVSERDDGGHQVVERDEAAIKLLVPNQEFSEAVEPTVCHLDNPASGLLGGLGAMLHVLYRSVRAANLYRQLGFVFTGASGTRAEMPWQATAV